MIEKKFIIDIVLKFLGNIKSSIFKVEVTNQQPYPKEMRISNLESKTEMPKEMKISNLPETQEVTGEVEVTKLNEVIAVLKEIAGKEPVKSQENLEEITIKDFDKLLNKKEVEFPGSIKIENLDGIIELLEKIKNKSSEVKMPDSITISNLNEIKIPEAKEEVAVKDFERLLDSLKSVSILSSNPRKPLAVRLSDGDKFYNAVAQAIITSSGGKATSENQVNGDQKTQIVDEEGRTWNLEQNGAMPVNIQDQTTNAMVVKLSDIEVETTVNSQPSIGDRVINVVDATGIVTGKYLTLYNSDENKVFFATVMSVSNNDITVDSPLDFAFPVDTSVSSGSTELNVNGNDTPQVFGVRNTETAIPLIIDITRIMFSCLTATSVDLSKFGDIGGGLLKGIVLRTKDGLCHNIFNAKTNGELANLMYDFDMLDAQNIQQGQHGFKGRLTFSGQDKFGVAVRLGPGDDLQLIIQDDLESLTKFSILIEGHEVTDS